MFSKILAIESSCDDTSIAIVGQDGYVYSIVSAAQDLKHRPFGGVVPEIAGRAHVETILPLIANCLQKSGLDWNDLQGIAVTNRPGLVGSLLVGVVTAKSISQALGLKLIGVNHLEAHLLAPFLKDEGYAPPENFSYPYIALAISGGHTQLYLVKGLGQYEVLGQTLDDAAGEAFDKFAKILGLGFPGGVLIDKKAKDGDSERFKLPRGLLDQESFNFSFSGLKTAGQRLIQEMGEDERVAQLNDICASFQEAIVDSLLTKLNYACEHFNLKNAVLTGGVSANSRLREKGQAWAKQKGVELVVPPIRYCTDNAAMVGFAGIQRLNRGENSDLSLAPSPRVYPDDFSYSSLFTANQYRSVKKSITTSKS